jgi:hypothetical protein
MTDMTIANEIASQIGHKAFFMMGTTCKFGDERSLTFNFKGCREWNKVSVILAGDDTYTVEFFKIGRAPKFAWKSSGPIEGVYCDGLHELIERRTGLATSLGSL